ncbi:hypothetical protein Alexa_044 [Acinetobacter phage vB_AbaP_Alexa]|nr:hypothetical protein Alexa_044 [Acinetobacter phage vB_AbaP_Alexa]
MEVLKEYLDTDYVLRKVKQTSGNNRVPNGWIEVPEGAECLLFLKNVQEYRFTKLVSLNVYSFNPEREKRWYVSPVYDVVTGTSNTRVLWQRPTLPEALPFIDDEPPAYYGNAIRPKPRKRMYAGIGRKVINVTIQIPAPVEHITFTGTVFEPVDDDCVRVPKASADYLFNTVRQMLADDFLSKDQKESVLHHLNYLKVH